MLDAENLMLNDGFGMSILYVAVDTCLPAGTARR
jgi:hypothetical protein